MVFDCSGYCGIERDVLIQLSQHIGATYDTSHIHSSLLLSDHTATGVKKVWEAARLV